MANKNNEPVKNVKPRGKAIRRTDEELDAMTSADAMAKLAEDAAEDFEENAPKKFKRLLGEKPSITKK
jgi:hypothetical protein